MLVDETLLLAYILGNISVQRCTALLYLDRVFSVSFANALNIHTIVFVDGGSQSTIAEKANTHCMVDLLDIHSGIA